MWAKLLQTNFDTPQRKNYSIKVTTYVAPRVVIDDTICGGGEAIIRGHSSPCKAKTLPVLFSQLFYDRECWSATEDLFPCK